MLLLILSLLMASVIDVEYTRVFEENRKATEAYVVNAGGARSSKSYSLAQLFIERFYTRYDRNILVVRKTLPSLRLTAYKKIIDLMKEYHIYQESWHNKTERTYINPRKNNYMVFTSVDDPEKIKSTEFNDIWMEEAIEFTYEDFGILDLRLSGPTTPDLPNQMFLSHNKSDEHSWIREKLLTRPNVKLIESTYKDNPFLPADYVRKLEGLAEHDPILHQIYVLNEWASVEGNIYHWDIVPWPKMAYDEIFYGIDWGYSVDPAVLVKVYRKANHFWVQELIYQTGLTNSDLIEMMRSEDYRIPSGRMVYCDSEDPKSIEDLNRAGFNAVPCKKGKNSVKIQTDAMRSLNIHIVEGSENIIREHNKYHYRMDKNGNSLGVPVEFMDHTMVAIRYAIFTNCEEYEDVFVNVG